MFFMRMGVVFDTCVVITWGKITPDCSKFDESTKSNCHASICCDQPPVGSKQE